MNNKTYARFLISLVLVFSMLAPTAVFAFADGKKRFQAGMKHEAAEEWDKAAEEFALAVAESPKNPEYRLHLTRALFNASQMYMKRGNMAAKDKDYEAAYIAYRKAYAFDPTNELAAGEMERMVRLQKEANEKEDKRTGNTARLVPTGLNAPPTQPAIQIPQKLEKLRDIPFPAGVDLQFIIKELARDLDLNVLFDGESFRQAGRKVNIDLKNVTAAKALDYIFLQEGLFFQKVGPRTIIVANQTARVKFQQLVLRTFYLANADPEKIKGLIQAAIPPQPGRTGTTVLVDTATNSITIRDTAENIKLIGSFIKSLDKDRAEVVMDVAIYEVSKNDLLQLGNQVGTPAQLQGGLGTTSQAAVNLSNNPLRSAATQAVAAAIFPTATAAAFLLPTASLSAFQSKNNTKLIASTQIHAFNNEDSSARIGQRVPVRSAQFQTGAVGNVGGVGGGVVSDVINYEQVGLDLKFKPLVFPNQDVQVLMDITSKDVSGAQTLTPTFTERTIKGTARIQNNKTLLLASVAQNVESNGRAGLPLLGLIPILGRLFTAPTRDNRQVDIVIAVTPRVIRAPNILPEDEIERETGSMGMPTNNTLEAMIMEEEREEQFAAARRLSNTAVVQLPDQAPVAPAYVKTDATNTSTTAANTTVDNTQTDALKASAAVAGALKPIDTSAANVLRIKETSDTSVGQPDMSSAAKTDPAQNDPKPAGPSVDLKFGTELAVMKAGEKVKIPVIIEGSGRFNSAVVGLRFDDKKVAVRSVAYGDLFGTAPNTAATPFLNERGKMYVTLTGKEGREMTSAGTLAIIEIEALVDGKPEITFDKDVMNMLTGDGKVVSIRLQ